jgi:hypothetical protein
LQISELAAHGRLNSRFRAIHAACIDGFSDLKEDRPDRSITRAVVAMEGVMVTQESIGCTGIWMQAGAARRLLRSALASWEVPQVASAGANLFLLLAAYYVLKTVREALILTEGGAEIKSYACAVQALLLLALLPVYGAARRKFNGAALARGVLLFFILHLLIFS